MLRNEFAMYVEELLEDFSPLRTRAMFGGYGIYKDGIICALIIDNELYFKADNIAVEFYQTYNSRPFTYHNKNDKIVTMSYWIVPPEIMEDRAPTRNHII